MIELFGGDTPNVFKPLIALEELELDYRRVPIDILKGEQFDPAFLAISPNNRVPALIDHAPTDQSGPISVFESGAILLYLAEKCCRLIPTDERGRAKVFQWLMWQMSGQGPMSGQAGHFRHYAAEKIPYGVERFSNEVKRLYGVLDRQFAQEEYLAGEFSIADIACWPWILFRSHHGIDLAEFPNVQRWYGVVQSRPAVRKILGDFVAPPPPVFTETERSVLFGTRP